MLNVKMHQRLEDKKAKTPMTTINHEASRQTYIPSGSMEAVISSPIKPKTTKMKTVLALLDLGPNNNHVDPDLSKDRFLSSLLNTESHNKL